MKIKALSMMLPLLLLSISACQVQQKPAPENNENQQEGQKEDFIDVFPEEGENNNENGNPDDENNQENNNEENGNTENPDDDPVEEVVLSSISIVEPTKKEYETGDELDLTGLTIKAIYSDNTEQAVDVKDVTITGFDNTKKGEQTILITYEGKTASFKVTVNKKYDEKADSLESVDETDFSALYNTFAGDFLNYSSKTESFFNKTGAYDYYRHYQSNYVQDKVNLYTKDAQYSYPLMDEYLGVCNTGFVNLNSNYYSFNLNADSVQERMESKVNESDLVLVKENASYQDDLFTLNDLDEDYFKNHSFVRVSENKYQSSGDIAVYNDFVDICAPQLINEGYYMTFSKVTIELNPSDDVILRIRLYASTTQRGKLIPINKDQENRPNWYLLFAEATIYDVNQTTFSPVEDLL